jgi:hypothetical protein
MQNMAARGQAGSGNELMARMMAAQNSSNQMANSGNQIAAQAQQRALEALMQSGQMAGDIRNQNFGQDSAVASAQDEIARFNTQNRIGTQQRNVGSRNQANLRNLENQQNIMNQNTGLRNQQEVHNKGLYQQDFSNRMQKAGALANAHLGQASAYDASAGRTASMWSGIGQGVGQGLGSIAQYSAANSIKPGTTTSSTTNDFSKLFATNGAHKVTG